MADESGPTGDYEAGRGGRGKGESKRSGGARVASDWLRSALLENLGIKFVAFILALTVFILVHSQEDATVGVPIKVSYAMPEDRVMVTERVAQIEVVVKGSWRRVKRFAEADHDPVRVDLRTSGNGVFSFRPEMLPLPPGLVIESITPANMTVRFEPLARKRVPVQAMAVGEPARGYGVGVITVQPREVEVEGAEDDVRLTSQVYTEDISLSGKQASFTQQVALRAPRGEVYLVEPEPVTVNVSLVEELTARTIEELPVEIRAGRGLTDVDLARFSTEPSTVRVVLRGALQATERIEPAKLGAFIEVYPSDLGAGRRRSAPVQLTGVPNGVAIELGPRDVVVSTPAAAPNRSETNDKN